MSIWYLLECTDTDTGISIGPIRIRKFVIFKKCQYGYIVGTQSNLEEMRMIDRQRSEKKEEEISLVGQEKWRREVSIHGCYVRGDVGE